MWRPTNHDPASFERFRELRAAAGIGGVLCHALYLCNLAAPDDAVYEKSIAAMRNTMEVACAIGAHASSSTSARISAPASTRGSSACCRRWSRCSSSRPTTTWLLMENSAGAGGTIGRSIDELATIFERLGRPARLGICLDSCHLYVSGVDVTDPAALDACLDEVDASIGLDRLRALHVNDSKSPLGSNSDRHENIGEGLMGEQIGVFLGNPRLQDLPAVLETAGPEGHGPDANEIRRAKEIHARWVAK